MGAASHNKCKMKTREIYRALKSIVEPIHTHSDQMEAIAKWIEAEFEYKPQKLAISPQSKLKCARCGETIEADENCRSRVDSEDWYHLKCDEKFLKRAK